MAYLKSVRASGRLRFYDYEDQDNAGVDFGTASAGLLHGAGASGTEVETATADKKFLSYYTKCTATSGDSRGLYLRHTLGGTIASTGYGDAARIWAKVSGTGYSYACGVHATLSLDASATVTGSGAGLRATLGAASQTRTLSTGALAAIQADSDIGANNTMPTIHGFIRFTNSGSVNMANLFVVPNASNGTIFAAHTTQTMTHSLKIISENGTAYYIMCCDAATNRS